MKYASLSYPECSNLGDQIQSLAAEQYLPTIDQLFPRDSLTSAKPAFPDEKYTLIMNGWFTYGPDKTFPLPPAINPVFFGFYLASVANLLPGINKYILSGKGLEYLKLHAPIGCRDKRTRDLLLARGVDAYHSKCLTLTFPTRKVVPKKGKVFLVEPGDVPIPEHLLEEGVSLSHWVKRNVPEEEKRKMAANLLERYRKEARLVITTRLHCAMPCVAMGIPVVFFGDPWNPRISLLREVGLKIHLLPPKRLYHVNKFPLLSQILNPIYKNIYMKTIDWNPPSLDIASLKSEMVNRLKAEVARAASGENC